MKVPGQTSLVSLGTVATLVASGASAWSSSSSSSVGVHSQSRAFTTTTPLHMASKGAAKWEKKQAWLEKRGLNADGTSSSSESSSSSSSSDVCTIIGGGRIGSLLAQSEGESIVLGRNGVIDADGSGPILIATRNDALDGI
eukprot:scaffold27936_cov35-Attheya_sp.AAC.1